MNVSRKMLELLATDEWEGTVLHIYKDDAGIPTIGIGHKILKGENFSSGIAMDKALYLLRNDMQYTVDFINHAVQVPLTQNQFDALCSLVFNIGTGAFAKSIVLRRINKGDMENVPDAFRMWNKITVDGEHEVNEELVERREREIKIWEGELRY